jgi:hypothetical protein
MSMRLRDMEQDWEAHCARLARDGEFGDRTALLAIASYFRCPISICSLIASRSLSFLFL